MSRHSVFYSTLRTTLLLLGASLLVGWGLNQPWPALAVALLLLLGWHLLQVGRLLVWLQRGAWGTPLLARGIWGEIFFYISRQQLDLNQRLSHQQEMLSHINDAVLLLGKGSRVMWCSPQACRWLGLQGMPPQARLSDHLPQSALRHLIEQADPREMVIMAAPAAADVTLQFGVRPLESGWIMLLAHDVTQEQRLERMRRDFVANVSHELRTPLTVIRGFVETMVDSGGDNLTEWKAPLQLMEQQCERMGRLIEDLLLLSRLESGVQRDMPQDVDVGRLLHNIVAAVGAEAHAKGVVLNLDIQSSLPLVGYETEIYSAINNLIANAVRYTEAGGRVDVAWWRDVSGATLEVRDSGIGIEAQHLPRLTERFYRVDVGRSRYSGGTGLGLAIVKHVLNHHRAQLQIESRLGQGSTFRVHFPPSRR